MTQKSKTILAVLFSVGVVVALWFGTHVASDAVSRWIGLSIAVVANLFVWVIWFVDRKKKGESGSSKS